MPTPIKWGSEFLVNTTTADSQSEPNMTALADGRFVVTWQDESAGDFDIRAQIFNADGSKSGSEFIAHTDATDFKVAPMVTALQGGGFVLAWQDNDTFGISARVFDAAGDPIGDEIALDTAVDPTLVALAAGGFAILWEDTQDGDVRAQLYDAAGDASGPTTTINTTVLGPQTQPAAASLTNGGFVVVWTDGSANELGDFATGLNVRAQRYDENGFAVGSEFVVSATTAGDQDAAAVIGLADGRFVVAWQDHGGADAEIVAQIFNADGTKFGGEFTVHTTSTDDQRDISLTALADGRFVVTWTDYSQTGDDTSGAAVRAQVFNGDGTTSGDEFLVNTTTAQGQGFPSVSVLADGRLVFAWLDASQTGGDTDGNAIRGQIFEPRTGPVTLFGSGFDDSLVGTFLDDTIEGRSGDDELHGDNGQDTLRGEEGNASRWPRQRSPGWRQRQRFSARR
ncbi:MAG: calcium-binding protein [Methyloceanibacter sp.]|uniref:calcium-binding protein n=1 Tax=Methyloceanibacter sp. TaxID=1965321 RepID=UPI003D6D60C5